MLGCLVVGGMLTFAAVKMLRFRRYALYGHHGHHGPFGHFGHFGRLGHCGGRSHGGGWDAGGSGGWGEEEGPEDGQEFSPFPPLGGGRRWGRGRWSGRGMPLYLRFLSRRLDATPGQERAIAEAMEQFRSEVDPLRAEARKSRADLAAALRKPSFDEVLLGELFARHDEAIEKARRALVGLGTRVHEALDERQREILAGMIERGPGFPGHGHAW